jgi:hypothetical protein
MSDKHARGLDAETKSCFMHGDYSGKETCPGCLIDVASVVSEHGKEGGRPMEAGVDELDAALLAAKGPDDPLAISVDDLARDFVTKAKRYQSGFLTELNVRAWFKFVIAYGFCAPTPDATPENLPSPMAFRDAFVAMAKVAGDDDALRRLSGDPADTDKGSE